MSDLPPDADPAADPAADQTAAPAADPRPGWRDRVWSLPAVIAVALVSVILGGLGGAALASASDDAGDGRFGPGHIRIHRDGHLRPPGMMNDRHRDRQRERWREWRQEQRREMRPSGMPSPTRPTPTR